MTFKIFLSAIAIIAFVACNNRPAPDSRKQDIPKALDDKKGSADFASKRTGSEDMIENLYDELVSKDAQLKKLEEGMDALNKSKGDSTGAFDRFNGKNESFYRSANGHIAAIKDSVLRKRMEELITNHLTKYHLSIARHNALLETIKKNQLAIADLHSMLQIVRTLPLMDNYQTISLPNTGSLDGYIKQQEATIKLADTLVKK